MLRKQPHNDDCRLFESNLYEFRLRCYCWILIFSFFHYVVLCYVVYWFSLCFRRVCILFSRLCYNRSNCLGRLNLIKVEEKKKMLKLLILAGVSSLDVCRSRENMAFKFHWQKTIDRSAENKRPDLVKLNIYILYVNENQLYDPRQFYRRCCCL